MYIIIEGDGQKQRRRFTTLATYSRVLLVFKLKLLYVKRGAEPLAVII